MTLMKKIYIGLALLFVAMFIIPSSQKETVAFIEFLIQSIAIIILAGCFCFVSLLGFFHWIFNSKQKH